jgi:hypothetical protein
MNDRDHRKYSGLTNRKLHEEPIKNGVSKWANVRVIKADRLLARLDPVALTTCQSRDEIDEIEECLHKEV